MIVLAVDLPGPFPIGQVSFKSYLPRKKIYPVPLSVTRQSGYTVELNFTNPRLTQTPNYYGQFALSLGNKSPYIFSKFNPLNPLSPNSDQHQFSPNNIHMLPREMIMRVNKMITKEKML